jgi:hypothetical protein
VRIQVEYGILTAMKAGAPLRAGGIEDDFWTEHVQFFTAQFPSYYTKPSKVWGRFHTSREKYFDGKRELMPLAHTKGDRTYIMMQPYVLEPILTVQVWLYQKPKQYADQESPIGEVTGMNHKGLREVQAGNAQAWYYHQDKIIMLWECFFDSRFRTHPFAKDTNMRVLWQNFEQWLKNKFPEAVTLATPFNDPIAENIEEYQAFLKVLNYSPLTHGMFGKKI